MSGPHIVACVNWTVAISNASPRISGGAASVASSEPAICESSRSQYGVSSGGAFFSSPEQATSRSRLASVLDTFAHAFFLRGGAAGHGRFFFARDLDLRTVEAALDDLARETTMLVLVLDRQRVRIGVVIDDNLAAAGGRIDA